MIFACAAFRAGARAEGAPPPHDPNSSQAPADPPVPISVEATRLRDGVWRLDGEKHLFIDAMGLQTVEGVSFTVNPQHSHH
jgi:hypothetical protein